MELIFSLLEKFGDGLLIACTATEGDPSCGKKSNGGDFDVHIVIGRASWYVLLLGLRSLFVYSRSTSRRIPSRGKSTRPLRDLGFVRLVRFARLLGSLGAHLFDILNR